jgi:hypothetical protein
MPPEADEDTLQIEVIDTAHEGDAEGGDNDDAPQESSPEAIKVASLMGWKDPKAWKGEPPPGGLKSAEEFLADVPQVTKGLRKKVEEQGGKLDRVAGQLAKLNKRSTAQDVADAEARAEEAFEAGDFAKAKEILLNVGAAAAPDEPAAVDEFRSRNAWFGVDQAATDFVALLDRQFAAEAGGPDKITDAAAHMRRIEAAIKLARPDLFGATKTPKEGDEEEGDKAPARRAPLVNRGGRVDRARSDTAELTVATMTSRQRAAADTMNVSHADYVKKPHPEAVIARPLTGLPSSFEGLQWPTPTPPIGLTPVAYMLSGAPTTAPATATSPRPTTHRPLHRRSRGQGRLGRRRRHPTCTSPRPAAPPTPSPASSSASRTRPSMILGYGAASTTRAGAGRRRPALVFEAQEDAGGATTALADIGLNVDLIAAAGSTTKRIRLDGGQLHQGRRRDPAVQAARLRSAPRQHARVSPTPRCWCRSTFTPKTPAWSGSKGD